MRKWFVRTLIGGLLASVAVVPFAWAAPSQSPAAPANGSAGQGLEISPPVIELSADPGQTVTTEIRVRNVTKGVLIAKGRTDDFGAGSDESGQPKLLLDETGATRYSLKYWVSGVPDLTLAPQELKTATVTIKVPANAEPGGHFGVVRFTAVPPELQGTGVSLSASVGTLVLLRVSGAVTDNLSVAEFSAGQTMKDAKTGAINWVTKTFFEHGPVDFLVRLKNGGTVHEKAQGSITVKDTFGKKVATVNVNVNGGNVLPDSIRRFQQTLDQKQLFGHYTASLAMTYAGGKALNASLAFWVIPWKLILLLIVGLVVLIWLLRLALRRYNEHIIAQARRR
ncbi:MAG TPA: hypothetical protein VGH44_05460 [Candidatus Saccharimonadia bacterium]|jgi:hypothetical protein